MAFRKAYVSLWVVEGLSDPISHEAALGHKETVEKSAECSH
jgi:hypothetical protein